MPRGRRSSHNDFAPREVRRGGTIESLRDAFSEFLLLPTLAMLGIGALAFVADCTRPPGWLEPLYDALQALF